MPAPLNASNPSASATFAGAIVRGPCNNVDPYTVDTLFEIAKGLYGAVAALRTLAPPVTDARFHLLVPMLLVAATEAETIGTLVSIDLHRSAKIHVRTLGECASRAFGLIQPDRAALCTELHASLNASRKALLATLDIDPKQRALVSENITGATGPTFRQLEKKLKMLAPDAQVGPSLMEHETWSKWAHADILALADAAEALRAPTQDLKTALTEPDITTVLVLRSIDFGTLLLYVAQALGVNVQGLIDELQGREKTLDAIRGGLRQQILGDARKLTRILERNRRTLAGATRQRR